MVDMNKIYDFNEHRHRYACWTAARAASVSRFSNIQIATFINRVQLKQEVAKLKKESKISHDFYKEWFIDKVKALEKLMKPYAKDKSDTKKRLRNISFGIAAKVTSVYVKTYEVIPEKGMSLLSKVAFPPIDSFLLKKLMKNKVEGVRRTNWSTFKDAEYIELIDALRNYMGDKPFWMLEKDWDVNDDARSKSKE